MDLPWFPAREHALRTFSRHPSVSSFDCVSHSEGDPENGCGHRAEALFLACTFVRFTRSHASNL
jgi:hypothetical protein